jgi:adenylate cyclase
MENIVNYPGIIANVPALENSAAGVGTVNTLPEVDGVNRRIPLVVASNDKLYPSLSMEVLRIAAGDNTFQVKLNEWGVEKMRIPKFGPIATDELGRIWIDWSQKSQAYSITQLPDDFKGAVVLVGPTAAGIVNPLPTSIGAVYPNVAQAAVLGTMFNNVTIQRPDWAGGAEILGILVAGILLLFLTRWTYVGIGAGVIIIGAIVPLCGFAYSSSLWLVDATVPVGGLVLVMLHAYGIKFVSEF